MKFLFLIAINVSFWAVSWTVQIPQGLDVYSDSQLEDIATNAELLKKYLDEGGNANAALSSSIPLLSVACYQKNLKCIELLIDAGADVNFTSKRLDPVIVTAFVHTPDDMLKLLLKKGADPNLISLKSGDSVLHVLATGDYVSRVFGKESDFPEKLSLYERLTIEKYAQKEKVLLDLLVQSGADLTLKNNDGVTPLQMARRSGIKRLIKLMEEKLASEKKKNRTKQRGPTNKGGQIKGVRTNQRCGQIKGVRDLKRN